MKLLKKYIWISRILSPYNIALLQLETELNFTKYIQPSKLPAATSQPSGDAVVTGWGVIENAPNPYTPPIEPLVLQTVNVPTVAFKGKIANIVWSALRVKKWWNKVLYY